MKGLTILLTLFTCARLSQAQVNYVLNPSFEQYSNLPNTALGSNCILQIIGMALIHFGHPGVTSPLVKPLVACL